MKMAAFPGLSRSLTIEANKVQMVTAQEEIFYGESGGIVYVINLVTADQNIQVDASSCKETEVNIGKTVAEYLGVPFVWRKPQT